MIFNLVILPRGQPGIDRYSCPLHEITVILSN